MGKRITGTSRDFLIHPGETIEDILVERGISQSELAAYCGVSSAYVNKVISGKKDISPKFAHALEYALRVPKSFWLNLQANYDAELLEYNEMQTITTEERVALQSLSEILAYIKRKKIITACEEEDDCIVKLRNALGISNLANLKNIVPAGAFSLASGNEVDPYVFGAWIRMCQIMAAEASLFTKFRIESIDEMIDKIKTVMTASARDIQADLKAIFAEYGIDFYVMRDFPGAPVYGYITKICEGAYQLILTIKGRYTDIFWFSLFHELGHLINGDLGSGSKFLDYGSNLRKEKLADGFAREKLINSNDYRKFLEQGNFNIDSIRNFATSQRILPSIVIGLLQKENIIGPEEYNGYRKVYQWSDSVS